MASVLDIAQVIQDAHDFDFWRAHSMDSNISEIVAKFLDALAQSKLDFVLVGGLAMLAYVEGRNTKDIDLIVTVADLEKIPGLEITFQERDFARATFQNLQIDVLKKENRLFDLIQREHTAQIELAGHTLAIATPKGLVLLKLYALPSLYRQGIFDRVALYETDIAMLLQRFPMNRAEIFSTLDPLLSKGDIKELDEILNDIEKRIRRFREQPPTYEA